ncbi:MAG: fructosamine kinase family protein [Allosphingosinicella sp.]
MSAFSRKVAALAHVPEDRLERLAGGDLSEVLLVRRPDGRLSVAKGGPATGTEAAMLRALVGAGVPAPLVEGEHEGVLLLQHVPNDGVFSPAAWTDIGAAVRRLHQNEAERYGWPVDFRIGTVELHNDQGNDWPAFWGEQRLVSTAAVLDRPWRERVERLAGRIGDLLPAAPPAALLHGDLWGGNILVSDGKLAALIDPACYYGAAEVDLAMLCLFDAPPDAFWDRYGRPEAGWPERRAVYQLFPALVHLRLFGASYAPMADRLLAGVGG